MWQAEADTELTISALSATAVGQLTLTRTNSYETKGHVPWNLKSELPMGQWSCAMKFEVTTAYGKLCACKQKFAHENCKYWNWDPFNQGFLIVTIMIEYGLLYCMVQSYWRFRLLGKKSISSHSSIPTLLYSPWETSKTWFYKLPAARLSLKNLKFH